MTARPFTAIYPRLSARERVVAMLEAHRAGKQPDPHLFSTIPPEQGSEYNRFVRRLDRLEREGRAWVLALARGTSALETLSGWLLTVHLVAASLEALADDGAAGSRRRARSPDARDHALATLQHRLACCAFPAEAGDSAGEEPRALLPILEERLRRDLGDRWAELRAFEIEVDDLAGTLDCPDVLLPELRVALEECRERLQGIAAEPRHGGEPVALAEPGEQYLERVVPLFRPDA